MADLPYVHSPPSGPHRAGYDIQTFQEYLFHLSARSIVLRHDVYKRPQNSLELAKIESQLGLKGTYNFRARSNSGSLNSNSTIRVKEPASTNATVSQTGPPNYKYCSMRISIYARLLICE